LSITVTVTAFAFSPIKTGMANLIFRGVQIDGPAPLFRRKTPTPESLNWKPQNRRLERDFFIPSFRRLANRETGGLALRSCGGGGKPESRPCRRPDAGSRIEYGTSFADVTDQLKFSG